jgi:hypothetical protein
MFTSLRKLVFSLYERPLIRNWFYTFAFAIFVPVGLRFAILAWNFGGDVDRLLTIIGGITVGATAAITLLRIWSVPPSKTAVNEPESGHRLADVIPNASEMLAAAQGYSSLNRRMAMGARALGSPRRPR